MSVGRKWRCSNKYCPTRKTWVQQQRCGFPASSPRFVALMQGYVDIDEKEEILGAAKEAVKAIVVDTPICWYCRNSAESISEDQAVAVERTKMCKPVDYKELYQEALQAVETLNKLTQNLPGEFPGPYSVRRLGGDFLVYMGGTCIWCGEEELQKHEEPLIERLIARSLEHAEMIIAAMVRVKAELQCPK
jgi:hypothetical protein